MNAEAERGSVRTNLGGCGSGAESNCSRAMAEAESVLRELSSSRASGANRVPGRLNTADETPLAPSLTPQRPGTSSLAPPSINYLLLDPGLDFTVHDGGMIELTEAGFRRMGQAHSAGLDTVIEVDRRRVLHFPGPRLGCSSSAPTG
jgi:hypothetical protein